MASDLRSLPREFLTEFIDCYKSYPCLWQIKNKDYSNKQKKSVAYEKLVQKLREVEPGATKEIVIKKINSLRTCFRREHRKVSSSEKSGAGADDIYVSVLWYYNLLSFLNDQEEPRSSITNIADDEAEDHTDQGSQEKNTPSEAEEEANIQEYDSVLSPSATSSGSKTPTCRPTKKKIRADNVLELVAERLKQPAPNVAKFENFGKHVAEQLRSVPPEQGVYLQKIINDAIFEAQCGSLTKQSRIMNAPIPTPVAQYHAPYPFPPQYPLPPQQFSSDSQESDALSNYFSNVTP